MVRDMEELLNQIRDYEIREYMKEALYCYNSKSYKACIMLSMSAAMYDLHNKVKVLAPIIEECRKLDEDITQIKEELKPYEKIMVERCSSNNIGILSSSEGLILQHYRDIRNLCSHPSGHKSSPEEARLVFSGVIDILLSKPPLMGVNHKEVLFNQLKENTFFPNTNIEIIEKIVEKKVDMIHSSARYQIAKFLIQKIKESHNNVDILETKQIENTKIFISYMYKFCDIKVDDLLQILIEDNMCIYDLLDIVYINPEILNYLGDVDIIKIVSKIKDAIEDSRDIEDYIYVDNGLYIADIIYNLLNLDRKFDNYDVSILLDYIFNVRDYNMRTNIIENILEKDSDQKLIEHLYTCIINDFEGMSSTKFYNADNQYLRKILEIVDGEHNVAFSIFNRINLALDTSDFYYQNDALNKLSIIDDRFKKNIDGALIIDMIVNVIKGSSRGSYKCMDIVKGDIRDVDIIIENGLNQIINSSDDLNYILSKLISPKEFIRLIINNGYEEQLNILIDKINDNELVLDNDCIEERILKNINTELESLGIDKKINL